MGTYRAHTHILTCHQGEMFAGAQGPQGQNEVVVKSIEVW